LFNKILKTGICRDVHVPAEPEPGLHNFAEPAFRFYGNSNSLPLMINPMAGIYIHIPFCHTKCNYCNFFSVVSSKFIAPVYKAILEEIAITHEYLNGRQVQSVYFGGGTPSLLPPAYVRNILDAIARYHSLDHTSEITLEANPDDLTPENLKAWIDGGINRISLGIQSFEPADLAYLDRRHDRASALKSLNLLAHAPLNSWTVDLIFNIPGQSTEMLEKNLQICIEAGVPHISCYALTVEEKTLLHQQIRKKNKPSPQEDAFREHFSLVIRKLTEHGYLHYETSNFALPGHTAVHNSGYWFQQPYLGLGPSAHSYNGVSRRWNPAGIQKYLAGISAQKPWEEEELLTPEIRFNEFIMTRIRTNRGIALDETEKMAGPEQRIALLERASRWLASGHLRLECNHLILTLEGMYLSDLISTSLFVETA